MDRVEASSMDYIGIDGLMTLFNVGRTSAFRIMDLLPYFYVLRNRFVRREDLDEYIREHGGIQIAGAER